MTMIKNISVQGLRGFATKQTVHFAIPDSEKAGSGLTFIVGSNNSGKTTVYEALRAFNVYMQYPSLQEGMRNRKVKNIELEVNTADDKKFCLYNTPDNPSFTRGTINGLECDCGRFSSSYKNIFFVPSRRFIEYDFMINVMGGNRRDSYSCLQNLNAYTRRSVIDNYTDRLSPYTEVDSIQKRQMDKLLEEVLGYKLNWNVDLGNNGQYHIRVWDRENVYTSEGLGDGIWSVFVICDALYDSQQGDIIYIDEPELSLHPMYQRRIMNLLLKYSKDRQIILNTHSPYFISFEALQDGAELNRTVKEDDEIRVYRLTRATVDEIKGMLNNRCNPHQLGLEAREVFFLQDNVILTEGQEDVIMYRRALKQLKADGNDFFGGCNYMFYGWGAGGAEHIQIIARLLGNLGYKKVFAIYDGDKYEEQKEFCASLEMSHRFKSYVIPTDDVRDKAGKEGLVTKNGEIKPDKKAEVLKLFRAIKEYFNGL